jgi:uncharacterized protein (UPF0262 family)
MTEISPSTDRIEQITLDEATILKRNDDIERERSQAIHDLLAENTFAPLRAAARGHAGPWRLYLAIDEGRLQMEVRDAAGEPAETLLIAMGGFRRPVRDYFAVCDSYYGAVRRASASEIETLDMARRAIHDRGSRLLLDRLESKVECDFATARRLFTLICVLHIKG